MPSRQKFFAALIWLLSATAFAWSAYILTADSSGYSRNGEVAQIVQSLAQLSGKLPAGTQRSMMDQAARNLEGITDGTRLLEDKALGIFAFLALLSLGLATLNFFGQPRGSPAAVRPFVNQPDRASWHAFQGTLDQTIAELGHIKESLQSGSREEGSTSTAVRQSLEEQCSDIVAMESQLVFIKGQVQQLSEQNSLSLESLRKLTVQADDFAGFSATSRLEWNALAIKLNQFKETQGNVRGKAEMLSKAHQVCQELLTRSLEFTNNHSQHAERAKGDVARMHDVSRGTIEIFSKLIHAMSESNSDVALANRLVKGLSERAEEIVNIIDVIDDIAEQTNQLALNASIEAARAGEQGKGFAVVAAEVRNLAVRSSTATRSITELLETIQAEADQASTCLEKTNSSVGTAHARIVDVDQHCRETMNLSRQVASELSDIIRVTGEHSLDIATIEKQGLEVSRLTVKLIRQLDDLDQINNSTQQESNQLAVNTDRVSRLMSRQYYAIQYVERIASSQAEGFKSLEEQSTHGIARSQRLRSGWERQFRQLVTTVPATRTQANPDAKAMAHIVAYCQTNLDIIRGSTLGIAAEPIEEDSISLKADRGPPSDDDDDITIDSNLQKAS